MKINSKKKGSRGELEWANFCKKFGFDVRRTQQYCGKSGEAADCIGLKHIHQEVKRVENLNVQKAFEQASNDKKTDEIAIVAHRKNNKKWLVTMAASDWIKFYKDFLKNNG